MQILYLFLVVAVFLCNANATATTIPLHPLIRSGQTAQAIVIINTSLHTAARHGNLPMVKYLIEELGMEVDYVDTDETYYRGNTALHEAAIGNHVDVASYLLENGADIHRIGKRRDGFTPLHYAASYGNLEMAELLEANGANVNAVVETKVAKRVGITPLHLAVEDDKHVAMVDFLIDKGADPAYPSRDGTPLAYAGGRNNYFRGDSYEPKSGSHHGIHKTKRDGKMWEHVYTRGLEQGKFLHVAAEKMRIDDIRRLLAMDVDVNEVQYHTVLQGVAGDNSILIKPMTAADKIARTEIARVLIDAGADVNLNPFWFPPLHRAVQTENVGMVKLLLANDADPKAHLHASTKDAYDVAKEQYEKSKSTEARQILELLEFIAMKN